MGKECSQAKKHVGCGLYRGEVARTTELVKQKLESENYTTNKVETFVETEFNNLVKSNKNKVCWHTKIKNNNANESDKNDTKTVEMLTTCYKIRESI